MCTTCVHDAPSGSCKKWQWCPTCAGRWMDYQESLMRSYSCTNKCKENLAAADDWLTDWLTEKAAKVFAQVLLSKWRVNTSKQPSAPKTRVTHLFRVSRTHPKMRVPRATRRLSQPKAKAPPCQRYLLRESTWSRTREKLPIKSPQYNCVSKQFPRHHVNPTS